MNYLPFAILAQLLNSAAVTVDKFLLSKTITDPLIYIFYFCLMSVLFLFGIPFVLLPNPEVLTLASASSLTWIIGAYLMLKALKSGQVQRVIPMIGAATPLFLLLFTIKSHPLTSGQITAVVILIAGLIFLTLQDLTGKIAKRELSLEIGSALFFAFAYYFLSLGFQKQDFLTVLVWSRPILILLGLIFLIIPALRKRITAFVQTPKTPLKSKFPLFIFGQICAVTSELLLLFSISLASPAIVNSLQGIKYVFLIIFSLILGTKFPAVFKFKFSGFVLISQIAGVILVGIGLYILAFSS